jgi:hypothetical protein
VYSKLPLQFKRPITDILKDAELIEGKPTLKWLDKIIKEVHEPRLISDKPVYAKAILPRAKYGVENLKDKIINSLKKLGRKSFVTVSQEHFNIIITLLFFVLAV